MNIPQGKPILKNTALKGINYQNMLTDLINKKFNGYICITIKDIFGIEDSVIILEDGIIKGAYHNFIDKSKDIFGDDALKIFMSNITANIGTIEIYSLSKEQTELVLTFNDKLKTYPIKDMKILNQYSNLKVKYNLNLEENKESNVETKYDLFKKIGLGNINI